MSRPGTALVASNSTSHGHGLGGDLLALVVEDSELDQYLVQRMLLDVGFTVEVASSAEDAILLAAHCQPDIVCCDVRLPGADGHVLCTSIRARYPDAYIPFIFITGLSDEQDLLKCFAAGGDDVMIKPVSAARLHAKVAAALRTRDLHRVLSLQRDQLARYQTDMQRDMEIAKTIIDNLNNRA